MQVKSREDRKGVFIDATEAFLCAIFELREDTGLPPRRAEIHGKMGLSHTASGQRLARLESDGLITMSDDGRLRFTPAGEHKAATIMRKHRLAERLLVDIIGLEWDLAHEEAERWQHVLGERVERKLLRLLAEPWRSPFGNTIPALDELAPDLAERCSARQQELHVVSCAQLYRLGGGEAQLHSIGERVQADQHLLRRFQQAAASPGATVHVSRRVRTDAVVIRLPRAEIEVDLAAACSILVAVPR